MVVVVVVVSAFKLAKLALALVVITIVVVVEGEGERVGTPVVWWCPHFVPVHAVCAIAFEWEYTLRGMYFRSRGHRHTQGWELVM